MSEKRGAIFDWDGVIINSATQHELSWERLALEEKLSLPDDHFKKGFGMRNEIIIPELLEWSTDLADVKRLSLRKEALYREIVREHGMVALPGVESWLKTLKATGIACVIGSSTHRENIITTLEVLGLGGFFDAMVTSENVKHGKPDPEVFLRAAEKIGVEPENGIVFEDALVGIAAGHAAGMKVVAVSTTNPREALSHADWVVDRLDQLTVPMLWK